MLAALPPTSRDRAWTALLGVSFVSGLAVSWHRWGNPLIDTGREMNVPLRMMSGEHLYSDIRHIYGPLSPWLHAALYRLFGPSLGVLYADGILCAAAALALVYWLARRVMRPAGAGAATLSMMWLCVFKPAGNYILPYSYNALHGTVLGLATLAVLTRALRAPATGSGAAPDGAASPVEGAGPATRPKRATAAASRVAIRPLVPTGGSLTGEFALAGVLAGLTLLAKTEMGVAALAAGLAAAPLAGGAAGARLTRGLLFVVPAVGLAALVYGLIAADVGPATLVGDSWLLPYNLPPALATYNARLAGLDHPMASAGRVVLAVVKLGLLAAVIAAASVLAARRASRLGASGPTAPEPERPALPAVSRLVTHGPWHLLGGAAAVGVLLSITTGLDWDKGPYLAMPVLLAGLLVAVARALRRGGGASPSPIVLLVYAVYALASLARLILRVRSGGAYGSFLLPVSIVLFTYLWVGPFADLLRGTRAAAIARRAALALILIDALATAALLGYRYQTRMTVPIRSDRGTMIAERDVGVAWNEALAYIKAHTEPADAVAVVPEGTSLTFLSGRRNPLREEIVTPGFLDGPREARAIAQLQQSHTRLVLVANRPTAEFGPNAFGRDYAIRLMQWVEANYRRCGMFGPVKDPALEVGDRAFFIRAYCIRDAG